MPAINYCIYKTNIWCIPTTEIATWWQVAIAAIAVFFAVKAIRATNETSKAVLDRDQRILDAKRKAFLTALATETDEILIRVHQMRNLFDDDKSKKGYEHTFHVLRLLEGHCIERCIEIVESFKSNEARLLTKCSLSLAKAHAFVKGNEDTDLADDLARGALMASFDALLKDMLNTFSTSAEVFAKSAGLTFDSAGVAAYARDHPLRLSRAEVEETMRRGRS